MITLRKLQTLPPASRIRKAAGLFRGFGLTLFSGKTPDWEYLLGLLSVFLREDLPEPLKIRAAALVSQTETARREGLPPDVLRELGRKYDDLHYQILAFLGVSPGDWDFHPGLWEASGRPAPAAVRKSLPIWIYLDDLRSPFNVGSIFRTAEAFGAESLFLSPQTPGPEHPRTRRSAMGSVEHLFWERRALDGRDWDIPVFALELGGTPLDEFVFPSRGMVLVGSEEMGLSAQAERLAAGGLGKVSIPLFGKKASLNVGVALGILLYAWTNALS